jgi:hypothetical protein
LFASAFAFTVKEHFCQSSERGSGRRGDGAPADWHHVIRTGTLFLTPLIAATVT